MQMGATLGCDCRRKMYNYSLKKRDDGQYLPINSYEMNPSKYMVLRFPFHFIKPVVKVEKHPKWLLRSITLNAD
jgi:hypothetical protein